MNIAIEDTAISRESRLGGNAPSTLVFFVFFVFFILRRMGKNKALAHHTPAYFHTRRVSI